MSASGETTNRESGSQDGESDEARCDDREPERGHERRPRDGRRSSGLQGARDVLVRERAGRDRERDGRGLDPRPCPDHGDIGSSRRCLSPPIFRIRPFSGTTPPHENLPWTGIG